MARDSFVMRTKRAGLVLPGLFALLGLIVLTGLGTWQLQRLHWKEGLTARIEARAGAEPVTLDEAVARQAKTGDIEYLRVRAAGRFLYEGERHFFAVSGKGPGWHVYTPLVTQSGRTVIVNRGFVPDRLKDPSTRSQGQQAEAQTVTGLARAPGVQGLFTPDNDRQANSWYWRDLEGMASGLNLAAKGPLVPFFLEAEKGDVAGGWPKGGVTRLSLPNRHLEYALTWYGLAGTLLAVFAVFARGRLRAQELTNA